MSANRSSCAATTCAALAVLLAGGLAGGLLAGCDYSLNTDLTVGGELVPPALVPMPALPDAGTLPAVSPAPPSSVVAVTRDNWADTEFIVPIAWVEHRAVTGVHPRFTSPAVRGVTYPTEATVLNGDLEERVAQQALEGIAAPVYSGLDLLMAIPRMFVAYPWEEMRSPREAYERAPQVLPRVVVVEGVVEEAPAEPAPAGGEP